MDEKEQRFWLTVVVLVGCTLISTCGIAAHTQVRLAEINAAPSENEIKRLQQDIAGLQQDLAEIRNEHNAHLDALRRLQRTP